MIPVLQIKNVSKIFGPSCSRCLDESFELQGNICSQCGSVIGCRNVSFDLDRNEVLGVVGESGSGKSTLVKILFFQEEPTAGEMRINLADRRDIPADILPFLDGQTNLFSLNAFQKRQIRNILMGIVYQNPLQGLKMEISAGGNIGERLLMAGCRSVSTIRQRAQVLLEKTEVPAIRMDEPPKNFSGGMQQRVQIAKALSVNPLLLFLDEPTTGLDLSVQARVLDLLRGLQKELHLTTMVVSHDLGIIRHLTTRSIVMKDGSVVEAGLTDQILEDPQHEFTQLLVNSSL